MCLGEVLVDFICERPVEEMTDSQQNTVAAIIRAAEAADPPRRLVLGSDAWQLLTGTLRQRLADVEAQRDNAATADVGRPVPVR